MKRWLKTVSDFLKKSEFADYIFIKSICISMAGIFLSIACLASGTWAWFSASAGNTVSKIRTASFEVVITDSEGRGYKADSNGEYQLQAGTYYVTVDPSSGPAPAYCLVTVVETPTSRELGRRIYAEYYADAEEDWKFVTATDSNALYEIEAFGAATPSQASYDEGENKEFEYDFITMSVVKEGEYRYEWEAGTERSFELVLDTAATVTFQALWKVASDSNAEVPDIEEMTQEQIYVFRYEVKTATPGNAAKEVTGQTGTMAAGGGPALGNGAAAGGGPALGNGAAAGGGLTLGNGAALENGAAVGGGAALENGAAAGNGAVLENDTVVDSGGSAENGASAGNGDTVDNSGAAEGSDIAGTSGAAEGSDIAGTSRAAEGSDIAGTSGAAEESDAVGSSGAAEGSDAVGSSGAAEGSDAVGTSGVAGGSDAAENSGIVGDSDMAGNPEAVGYSDIPETSGAAEGSDISENSGITEDSGTVESPGTAEDLENASK